jgi:putative phage-type endonuclease
MKIIDVVQRTPSWETWRAAGVTASEAAIVLGSSPYKTAWRLWAERTGVCEPADLTGNPVVQRGIALEDEARRGFEERHRTLLLPVCGESDQESIIRASFDGLDDNGSPVELKAPHPSTYQKVLKEGVESVPYKLAWVQVQTQLYVAGASQGWLVFHQTPAVSKDFPVVRDEAFIQEMLVPQCLQFWDAIANRKAPAPDPTRDLYLPTDEALRQWTQAASSYRKLTAQRHDLEDSLKALKAQMGEAEGLFVRLMGEYLLAECEGIRVTRYLQSGSVDYPALLAAIAPSLDEATLDRFRRKPSERLKVTLQPTT